MPSYIAFLRGINVGGHRVTMERLRGFFGDLGFVDVSTFLASGNVTFATDSGDVRALRGAIEERLAGELGYEVPTFLRTPDELAALAGVEVTDPESESSGVISHYVIIFHETPGEALRSSLADLESDVDAFHVTGREVHWRIRGKLSGSPLFGGSLDRVLADTPNTMRNMNTIRRLVAKLRAT